MQIACFLMTHLNLFEARVIKAIFWCPKIKDLRYPRILVLKEDKVRIL